MPKSQPKKVLSAYTAKRDARQQHPLNAGRYKLKDALFIIDRHIGTIKNSMRGFPPGTLLGSCVAGEEKAYIPQMIFYLAENIGYNIEPAIEALRLEHLTDDQIDHVTSIVDPGDLLYDCMYVRPTKENILDLLEEAADRIKTAISTIDKYEYMRSCA